MISQPGEQLTPIQILHKISKYNSNQAMKFDQLIEYNIRNLFLEKLYTACGEKRFPEPFLQFVVTARQVEDYRNILKLAVDHLILPHIKHFKKTKRSPELFSLPHFLYGF